MSDDSRQALICLIQNARVLIPSVSHRVILHSLPKVSVSYLQYICTQTLLFCFVLFCLQYLLKTGWTAEGQVTDVRVYVHRQKQKSLHNTYTDGSSNQLLSVFPNC